MSRYTLQKPPLKSTRSSPHIPKPEISILTFDREYPSSAPVNVPKSDDHRWHPSSSKFGNGSPIDVAASPVRVEVYDDLLESDRIKNMKASNNRPKSARTDLKHRTSFGTLPSVRESPMESISPRNKRKKVPIPSKESKVRRNSSGRNRRGPRRSMKKSISAESINAISGTKNNSKMRVYRRKLSSEKIKGIVNQKRSSSIPRMRKKKLDKIIYFVGKSGCGKSKIISLLSSSNNDTISEASETVSEHKNIYYNNEDIKYIMRCSEIEENNIETTEFENAGQIVMVYDVTDTSSLEYLKAIWDIVVSSKCPNIILVGNKMDQSNNRSVSFQDGYHYSESKACTFTEVSAESGIFIAKLASKLFKCAVGHAKESYMNTIYKKLRLLYNVPNDKIQFLIGKPQNTGIWEEHYLFTRQKMVGLHLGRIDIYSLDTGDVHTTTCFQAMNASIFRKRIYYIEEGCLIMLQLNNRKQIISNENVTSYFITKHMITIGTKNGMLICVKSNGELIRKEKVLDYEINHIEKIDNVFIVASSNGKVTLIKHQTWERSDLNCDLDYITKLEVVDNVVYACNTTDSCGWNVLEPECESKSYTGYKQVSTSEEIDIVEEEIKSGRVYLDIRKQEGEVQGFLNLRL
eukprot:TRINITY_DN1744_c2_g1_i1.p1 TRINITY_DN1744_c2_g1~~TRINITY_DN1744_c2_g1_i1.p1  ORF type:complete len:632 (-),score=112.39 TRINITY_DN1744_c2_g1_i1:51-1946(-)